MSNDPAAPLLPPMRSVDPARRRRVLVVGAVRIALIAVVLLAAYFLLPWDRTSATEGWLLVVLSIVVLVIVNVLQLRAVARSDLPWLRATEALVVSTLLLLVTFAGLYLGMFGRDQSAFNESLDHVDSLYFTLTMLTTIGYGDIAPVSTAARVVVMVQMVINVVVLGVFVKLVTSTARSRRDPPA